MLNPLSRLLVVRQLKYFFTILLLTTGFFSHYAFSESRLIQNLDKPWQFIRAEASDNLEALPESMSWQSVSLPHTYNAIDGDDGGGYYRGPAWYKTTFTFSPDKADQRTYVEFDGAATVADVWINNDFVGRHIGGYARFRFDITNSLKSGVNTITVRTSNAKEIKAPPMGGDFTVFGGLYREVRLVTTAAVHIDMLDYGGSGIYLTANNVLSKEASLKTTARISNDTNSRMRVGVRVSLIDSEGKLVRNETTRISVQPKTTVPVGITLKSLAPRLWNGIEDPYLYTVRTELFDESNRHNSALDLVEQQFGFREIRIDNSSGVFLNGRQISLHGVNLFHSGRPKKGLAVSNADIDQDLEIFKEMGTNAVRLVHFQHPPHTYKKSDRLGYLIWTEIPMNGVIDAGQEFSANAVQQLRELIRQNYNHPSVMLWGLGNEVYKSDADSNRIFNHLQKVARAEDPGRPTIYAHCCSLPTAPHASHTDTIGYNIYNGWYPEQKGSMEDWVKKTHALLQGRSFSISEYGAGASVLQQEDNPKPPTPVSYWHPEQYQALFHETSWRQLRDKPYLWGTYIWVGFDLASDGRKEGDRDGINDKGLVTYDRTVRKDAYYWYQVNWSEKPTVYITSRRFTNRLDSSVTVKVYTNLSNVKLTVNGLSLDEVPVDDHIAKWDNVILKPGANEIIASDPASKIEDQVIWFYEDRHLSTDHAESDIKRLN